MTHEPIDVQPPQPPAVEDALAELVVREPRRPDPWWQAGVEESLET